MYVGKPSCPFTLYEGAFFLLETGVKVLYLAGNVQKGIENSGPMWYNGRWGKVVMYSLYGGAP